MLDTINNQQSNSNQGVPNSPMAAAQPPQASGQGIPGQSAAIAQKPMGQQPPTHRPRRDEEAKIDSLDKPAVSTFTWMFLTATIIFILAHIIFVVVLMNNGSVIKQREARFSEVSTQLAALAPVEQRARQLQVATTSLDKYFNEQMDWNKVWNEINARMLKRSRINSMSMDESGRLQLSGETTTLSDLAKIIVSFQRSEIIKDAEMVSSSFSIADNQTFVTFALSGQFDLSKVRKDN